ncbi:MAG: Uma2 family endonuclease [Gluconacetobacter diazotrophicus]|nr:Uma2 family endonuclease [Gluconacetobacter diazotrophicus]
MTRPEFLAWEEQQELRHEFDGVAVRAMTGGTAARALIQANLIIALGVGLRGKPCRVIGSELKVETASGYRYPDAMVICSPIAAGSKAATEPAVLFEIVSPSSSSIDFVTKNAEYRLLPSVQRYVVLQQNTIAAAVFSRRGEDWLSELVAGADAVLRMPELDLALPLAAIYRDIDLQPDPGQG